MCKQQPVPTELKPMIKDSLNRIESERLVAEIETNGTLRIQFADEIDSKQRVSLTVHLESGVVPITSTSTVCVDGRYSKEQSEGELGRAGADLGLSLALLALGYPPEEAFQFVFDFRASRGQKYGWHDDSHANINDNLDPLVHAHGDEINTGCGHCTLNIQLAEQYGVDADKVLKLRQFVVSAQNNPVTKDNMRFDTLQGNHGETGVMIIDDARIAVQHFVQPDGGTESQYFVYDRARDLILMKELADFISLKNGDDAGKLAADLKAKVKDHTNITVGELTKLNPIPAYTVSVRKDEQTDQPYLWVEFAK